MKTIREEVLVRVVREEKKLAVVKDFIVVAENKRERVINVTVGYFDNKGEELKSDYHLIEGDLFEEYCLKLDQLAIEYPESNYRDDALWYVIDKLQSQE